MMLFPAQCPVLDSDISAHGIALKNIWTKCSKNVTGAEIITSKKPSFKDLNGIMKDITTNVFIVYIQSTLKYAAKIDEAIENGEDFEKSQVIHYFCLWPCSGLRSVSFIIEVIFEVYSYHMSERD